MARNLGNNLRIFFVQAAFLLFLIAAIFISETDEIFASHVDYWFKSGTGAGCAQVEYHEDCGNKDCDTWSDFTCGSWQKGDEGAVINGGSGEEKDFTWYARCYCDIECLAYPANPKYNDDPTPKNNGSDNDINRITLPVVLSWTHVPGWKNDGKHVATCHGNDSDCTHAEGSTSYLSEISGVNNFGPQSYLVEIQDTTSANGIDNLNFADGTTNPNNIYAKGKSSKIIKTIGGKKAYYKVVNTNMINSVDDIWPCFFNSSGSYRWRVHACCDTQGKFCKEYGDDEAWWNFSVSTAPELVSPLDPDWNGQGSGTESFKNLTENANPLKWCSAKLPSSEQIDGQPTKYAGSYELYTTSDEDNSITDKIVDAVISAAKDVYTQLNRFTNGLITNPNENQQTHSLSIINGKFIYDILPDGYTGEVNTWFPAQSRGDLAYFTRNRIYSWKLRSCIDENTFHCYETDGSTDTDDNPEYSQEWKITTPNDKIDPPTAEYPKDVSRCGDDHDCACKEPVGFSLALEWSKPTGANSFLYETTINNFTGVRKTMWNKIPNSGDDFDEATKKLLSLDNMSLKLDTVYYWRVSSCANFDSTNCDEWSSESVNGGYAFCTTGRPPKADSMTPDLNTEISFPQTFAWEKVNGAGSYNFKLFDSNSQEVFSDTVKFGDSDTGQPSIQVDYPTINQPAEGTANISYTWKVQTCADGEGKRCGPNWASQYFVINRVSRPILKTTATEFDSLKNVNLAWESKTKNNLITITYSGASTQEGCASGTSVANYKSSDGICSLGNNCINPDAKTSCVGSYQYKIQPCVDPNCLDIGDSNALTGTFKVGSIKGTSSLGNFIVCGQRSDNLDTEWDEAKDCSIESLFLLIKLIINFILFKLGIILLPILALASGGIFYLGMKGNDTIPTIKKIWKYAGIGYAIMLMAWLIVTWLMAAIGYQGVDWWKVF